MLLVGVEVAAVLPPPLAQQEVGVETLEVGEVEQARPPRFLAATQALAVRAATALS